MDGRSCGMVGVGRAEAMVAELDVAEHMAGGIVAQRIFDHNHHRRRDGEG